MRTFLPLVTVFTSALLVGGNPRPTEAQTLRIAALNGTTDHLEKRYHGEQLDLVEGASIDHASSRPLVRHAYLVAPTVLALTIDERHKVFSPLVPYRPARGDEVKTEGRGPVYGEGRQLTVMRNGRYYGRLAGPDRDQIRLLDRIEGKKFNLDWAARPESYRVHAEGDPVYARPTSPVNVYRKSKPMNQTVVGAGRITFPVRHEVYLEFEQPLTSGHRYTVSFIGNRQLGPRIVVHFDDKKLRSEAVHVNQAGFAPTQGLKYALLSTWMGDGGGVEYDAGGPFHLIDHDSGEVAYTGRIELVSPADRAEYTWDGKDYNHNQTDVYRMDFSDFQEPGVYTVSVPGVGCSFPFRIDRQVWEEVTRLYLMGLLQQRSGIAVGPPWTDYTRPRPMHPDDGFKIYSHKVDVWYHGVDDYDFARPGEVWEAMEGRELRINSGSSGRTQTYAVTSGVQQDVTQVLRGFHHQNYIYSGRWRVPRGQDVVVELEITSGGKTTRKQHTVTSQTDDWTDFKAPLRSVTWDGPIQQATLKIYPTQSVAIRIDRVEMGDGKKKKKWFRVRQASIDFTNTIPGAWGGWMDAADFDRRARHFFIVHALLTAYEINPEYFDGFDLNIPESGNEIPDILDEALWGLELGRRTQGSYGPGFEGAVSLRVESVEHPRSSETSWTDSLDCGLDPPSTQHSYIYAAAAAHMASVLKTIAPERSEDFARSAEAAYDWAVAHPGRFDNDRLSRWPGTTALRNRAAAYLFKFHGTPRWQREYEATDELDTFHRSSDSGALLFSHLRSPGVGSGLQETARQNILQDADDAIAGMNQMAYGALRHTLVLGPKNLAARAQFVQRREAETVIAAWEATGDPAYLDAAARSLQYAMGNNPMNLSFVAGLGQRSAWPYLLDMRNGGLKPSVGMATYGPVMPQLWIQSGRHRRLGDHGLYPPRLIDDSTAQDIWPMAEGYIEEFYWAPLNEFTVWESAQQLLIAAVLAQHYAE